MRSSQVKRVVAPPLLLPELLPLLLPELLPLLLPELLPLLLPELLPLLLPELLPELLPLLLPGFCRSALSRLPELPPPPTGPGVVDVQASKKNVPASGSHRAFMVPPFAAAPAWDGGSATIAEARRGPPEPRASSRASTDTSPPLPPRRAAPSSPMRRTRSRAPASRPRAREKPRDVLSEQADHPAPPGRRSLEPELAAQPNRRVRADEGTVIRASRAHLHARRRVHVEALADDRAGAIVGQGGEVDPVALAQGLSRSFALAGLRGGGGMNRRLGGSLVLTPWRSRRAAFRTKRLARGDDGSTRRGSPSLPADDPFLRWIDRFVRKALNQTDPSEPIVAGDEAPPAHDPFSRAHPIDSIVTCRSDSRTT